MSDIKENGNNKFTQTSFRIGGKDITYNRPSKSRNIPLKSTSNRGFMPSLKPKLKGLILEYESQLEHDFLLLLDHDFLLLLDRDRSKQKANLESHLASIHDIGVKWYKCPHCNYKAKSNGVLKKHLAHTHNIGVKWYECPHCNYKTKSNSSLKTHLAYRHNIGVIWYECPHCYFEFKSKSNLKRHKLRKHNILKSN